MYCYLCQEPEPCRCTIATSTLGQYLSRIYGDWAYRANRPKHDPELSRERTNVILVYCGAFNPPHRGHLAVLWHAYTQLAEDLNIVAAIVHPCSENRLRCKCMYYPSEERRAISLKDRARLWKGDPNFPPWAWVFERLDGGWIEFAKRLKRLARKDRCRIRFAELCGPDHHGPDDQIDDVSEMRIVSDIGREADFDHQDGLQLFTKLRFGPWFVDDRCITESRTPAQSKHQMLSQWNEVQRQKRTAVGNERAQRAVTDKYSSVFDMSTSIFLGASDLAIAKVDGLLGLVGETENVLPTASKVDQQSLAIHLASLGSPKASSVCRMTNSTYLITLRFLRATPGQYAPFRGISSSEVQKLMRELEGYQLLSALECVVLSPSLLWDMLLPWTLQRNGSDYKAKRGSPLQLEMEQDLMVPPNCQPCLLEEYEWGSQTVEEVVASFKNRDASPATEPVRLAKRKRDFLDDTLIQSAGLQRMVRKIRKTQCGDTAVVSDD